MLKLNTNVLKQAIKKNITKKDKKLLKKQKLKYKLLLIVYKKECSLFL